MSTDEIRLSAKSIFHKPTLLLITSAALWPQDMAAKVRILNILKSASERFTVTFLGLCNSEKIQENRKQLEVFCRSVILLTPINRRNIFSRAYHRICSTLAYSFFGFPKEAYYAGYLNLSQKRVARILGDEFFDVVLFEYWFAADSARWFRMRNIPCVLDMHDIMWKKHETSVVASKTKWKWYWHFLNREYRNFEERRWLYFSGLISINTEENKYVRSTLHNANIINIGTGVDLSRWPYLWEPHIPPRVMFYGSLGSIENQMAADHCAKKIMPIIWEKIPDVEFWIVGANPSDGLRDLPRRDSRIKVTGFIEDIKTVLSSATVILCPNKGTYGFRSRVVEAMALGVPVIASEDAVYGMGLENGKGIVICADAKSIAAAAVQCIRYPEIARGQSLLAREEVERKYSSQHTYEKITDFLLSFV